MSHILILYGTRYVEREQGLAADFCPVCGKITPFRVVRLDAQLHIYLVPVTRGIEQGYIAKCTECACQLEVEPDRYKAVLRGKNLLQGLRKNKLPLEEIIRLTFPEIHEVYARELALAKQAATDPHNIPRLEREKMLLQRFAALAGAVQRGDYHDQRTKITLLIAVLCIPLVVGLMRWVTKGPIPETWSLPLCAILCAGLLLPLLWVALQPRRWLRKRILPQLVAAIAPLSPDYNEIQYCLEELEVGGWKMAGKISADMVWKSLEKAT